LQKKKKGLALNQKSSKREGKGGRTGGRAEGRISAEAPHDLDVRMSRRERERIFSGKKDPLFNENSKGPDRERGAESPDGENPQKIRGRPTSKATGSKRGH